MRVIQAGQNIESGRLRTPMDDAVAALCCCTSSARFMLKRQAGQWKISTASATSTWTLETTPPTCRAQSRAVPRTPTGCRLGVTGDDLQLMQAIRDADTSS
jgi:hypothetical protein